MKPGPMHEWAAKQPSLTTIDKDFARDFALASNSITFQFFDAIDEPGQNALISPLSMSFSLAMLGNGAKGKTQDAIYKALNSAGGPTPVNTNAYFLLVDMLSGKDAPISISNSLWLTPTAGRADPSFHKTLDEKYAAKFTTLSQMGTAGADEINKWVSEATSGMIDHIKDSVNPDDLAILVNAIAFQSHWKTEFDPKDTRPGEFTLANGKAVRADFMHAKKMGIDIANVPNVKCVRLPYKSEDFSLVLMLPEKETPEKFLEKQTWESWGILLGSFTPAQFDISLPKLSFKKHYVLNPALSKLGLGELFHGGDFSGVGPGLGSSFLSEAIQNTFIEFSEQGTRAAAATEMTITKSIALSYDFDRPFAFAIVHNPTNAIVLLGVVNDPSQP